MSFRLVKPQHVTLPVDVTPPGGKTAKINLTVQYLSVSEIKELLREVTEDTSLQDSDLAERLVLDWEKIEDEDGNPIPFSEDALVDALDLPYFHDAVTDALVDHLVRGRGKNFEPPARSGRRAKGK